MNVTNVMNVMNDECRLGSEVLTTSWFWWCDTQLICRFYKLMDWQNFWYWVDAHISKRTMHFSDPGLVTWILHNWFLQVSDNFWWTCLLFEKELFNKIGFTNNAKLESPSTAYEINVIISMKVIIIENAALKRFKLKIIPKINLFKLNSTLGFPTQQVII